MSDALVKEIAERPHDLEHRLATAMRDIGRDIKGRAEIIRALDVSDRIREGIVVTNGEQAAELADLMVDLIAGERALAEQMRLALAIPRQMEVALKGVLGPVHDRFLAAKAAGGAARLDYQNTVRRRAAEEEKRLREEAEAAAREAAAQAEAMGQDAPPPTEVAPIEVPRTIAGGKGKMGLQVRIEVGEIEYMPDVPDAWLALVPAVARAAFQAAERAEERMWDGKRGWVEVKRAAPGESVVWKGVRFWSRESNVNR